MVMTVASRTMNFLRRLLRVSKRNVLKMYSRQVDIVNERLRSRT